MADCIFLGAGDFIWVYSQKYQEESPCSVMMTCWIIWLSIFVFLSPLLVTQHHWPSAPLQRLPRPYRIRHSLPHQLLCPAVCRRGRKLWPLVQPRRQSMCIQGVWAPAAGKSSWQAGRAGVQAGGQQWAGWLHKPTATMLTMASGWHLTSVVCTIQLLEKIIFCGANSFVICDFLQSGALNLCHLICPC